MAVKHENDLIRVQDFIETDKGTYKIKAEPVMQFNPKRKDLGKIIPLETPLVIYVESSSHCNLECGFCPQHIAPEALNKTNMTVDLFKKM